MRKGCLVGKFIYDSLSEVETIDWRAERVQFRSAVRFTCGYCGVPVHDYSGWIATTEGFYGGTHHAPDTVVGRIVLCGGCRRPTYIDTTTGEQWPPAQPFRGFDPQHLPQDVCACYEDARKSFGATAYTACCHMCRKLLYVIAVKQGMPPKDSNAHSPSFKKCLEWLDSNRHIPPTAKPWVDNLRLWGNDAAHEVGPQTMDAADAAMRLAMLLISNLYEAPRIQP